MSTSASHAGPHLLPCLVSAPLGGPHDPPQDPGPVWGADSPGDFAGLGRSGGEGRGEAPPALAWGPPASPGPCAGRLCAGASLALPHFCPQLPPLPLVLSHLTTVSPPRPAVEQHCCLPVVCRLLRRLSSCSRPSLLAWGPTAGRVSHEHGLLGQL